MHQGTEAWRIQPPLPTITRPHYGQREIGDGTPERPPEQREALGNGASQPPAYTSLRLSSSLDIRENFCCYFYKSFVLKFTDSQSQEDPDFPATVS